MIDISDGLAADARHLARLSGVRLELSLAALPLDPGVAEVAAQLGLGAAIFAATAGDDYELCACIDPGSLQAVRASGMRQIGRVMAGSEGLVFTDHRGRLDGYEHSF